MAEMTLEEALAAATVDEELIEPVNEVLMIDPETKTINIPSSEVLFGVEEEQGVERKHFKCPRIVGDNIDLFTHKIYISYVKVLDDKATINTDEKPELYWCDDLAVDETENYITFSWVLSGNVLKQRGLIGFAVVAKSMDGDFLKTRWKTAPAIGTVLMTIPDAGSELVDKYPDIVTQLLNRMDYVEDITTPDAMRGYVSEYMEENPVQIDPELKDNTKAAPAGVVGELKGDLSSLTEYVEGVMPDYDKDNVKGFYFTNSTNGVVKKDKNGSVLVAKCLPNETYVITKDKDKIFSVGCFDSYPSENVEATTLVQDHLSESISITSGSESKYIAVYYHYEGVSTISDSELFSSINIYGKTVINIKAIKNVSFVENIDGLKQTTEKSVYVFNNDSHYGNGGGCWYSERDEGERICGEIREKANVLYPMMNQNNIPPANAPEKKILNVVNSWVGRTDIIHEPSTDGSNNTPEPMFTPLGVECKKIDGCGRIDCISFIDMILLGITYDNSRYNLGSDRENIENVLFEGKMPNSILSEEISLKYYKGGLSISELMRWFAEQKRLFRLNGDASLLCTGDILFIPVSEFETQFSKIGHVCIVLEYVPQTNTVIIAHNTNGKNGQENTCCQTAALTIPKEGTYVNDYCFARPNYRSDFGDKFGFYKKSSKKYGFEGKLIPGIYLSRKTDTTLEKISVEKYNASDLTYYKVVPNAKIIYTGNSVSVNGLPYYARALFYNSCYRFISYQNIKLPNNDAEYITVPELACFVRFVIIVDSDSDDSGNKFITLTDARQFSVDMLLPEE